MASQPGAVVVVARRGRTAAPRAARAARAPARTPRRRVVGQIAARRGRRPGGAPRPPTAAARRAPGSASIQSAPMCGSLSCARKGRVIGRCVPIPRGSDFEGLAYADAPGVIAPRSRSMKASLARGSDHAHCAAPDAARVFVGKASGGCPRRGRGPGRRRCHPSGRDAICSGTGADSCEEPGALPLPGFSSRCGARCSAPIRSRMCRTIARRNG